MADGSGRARWAIFIPLVIAVVVLDQLTKSWILANVPEGGAIEVAGPYVRLILSHNTGGLFGLFTGNAPVFAAVSIAVMVLIVAYEWRVGGAVLPTIALGLLLGGAIGNFIDRIHLGYVVDFVDMGIGDVRWYTYNVADAAISTSIVLLILMAVVPGIAELGATRPPAAAAASAGPAASAAPELPSASGVPAALEAPATPEAPTAPEAPISEPPTAPGVSSAAPGMPAADEEARVP